MSERPVRVLFIIGSMREGGAEGQVHELMRGLRERGYEPGLMLLRGEGARLPAIRAEGFPVFDAALPRFRPRWNPIPWLGLVGAVRRSVRDLDEFQPDIVHAWLFWAHVWGAIVTGIGGRSALITSRLQLGVYKDGKPWMQWIENWINRRSVAVVVNSKEVARDSRRREKHLGKRLRLVYGGIDRKRWEEAEPADLRGEFSALADASHIGIMVANLHDYKGHLDLVEAWRRVVKHHPRAKMLCVGRDGGMEGRIRDRLRREELDNHVVLAGPRLDVPGLTKGADFAVLCSHEEGFSNVVLEAMACGKAMVATRVGGNGEALGRGKAGLLVPPHDPPALSRAVCRVLEDKELRERLGRRGRRRVELFFSLENLIAGHDRLYRSFTE